MQHEGKGMMRNFILNVVSLMLAALISIRIGSWAVDEAARMRGYAAVGGEYILIPFMLYFTWLIVKGLIDIAWRYGGMKLRRRKRRQMLIKKYQARMNRT